MTQRQKQIDSWQKTVKDAGLNKQQRKEFQELVESRFHVCIFGGFSFDYLKNSGINNLKNFYSPCIYKIAILNYFSARFITFIKTYFRGFKFSETTG